MIDIDGKMFSVAAVQSAFHEALVQDQDVDVKNYVLAYQELCKCLSSPPSALMIHYNDTTHADFFSVALADSVLT